MKTVPRILAICVFLVAFLPGAAGAQAVMDRQVAIQALKHTDYGLRYLREHQSNDGAWPGPAWVTARALYGFLRSYQGYGMQDGAFITRPVRWLLDRARDDGAIGSGGAEGPGRMRDTAAAILALKATGISEYDDAITAAAGFLISHQMPDGAFTEEGAGPVDLPTQVLVLEALRAARVAETDAVWAGAARYLGTLQAPDGAESAGGFVDTPGGGAPSATATYAGLAGLLLAGVDPANRRVRAAHDWIAAHYSPDDAGRPDQAPFLFYDLAALALLSFGGHEIVTPDGKAHNWRDALVTAILARYRPDGSFGDRSLVPGGGEQALIDTALAVGALNRIVQSLR